MLTASDVQRLAIPGLAVLSLSCVLHAGAAGGPPVSITESFENGYGPWSLNTHIGGEIGGSGIVNGCDGTLEYIDEFTQRFAHDGLTSVQWTIDGTCDDGTIWLVRSIELPAGEWPVAVEFFVRDIMDAEIGLWEVKAYIATIPPAFQWDFTLLGFTGIAGWSPYSHQAVLTVDEPTTAYVAVAIRVAFETVNTYWIDSVTVSGIPPQTNPADLNGDGVIDGLDLALLLGAWGECFVSLPCPADLNGDGQVNGIDLALLLGEWTLPRS